MAKEQKTYLSRILSNNPYAAKGPEGIGFVVCKVDTGFASTPVTGTDGKQYDGEKCEVNIPIPSTDPNQFFTDCKVLYGMEPKDVAIQLGRTIGTKPNWKQIVGDKIAEGLSVDAAHEALLDVVANLSVKAGPRAGVGQGLKAKAAKLTGLEAEAAALGMTLEDLVALAKKQKAKKG